MVSARAADARRTSGAAAAAARTTPSLMATPAPLLVRFRLPPQSAAQNGAEVAPNGRLIMTRVSGKRRDSSTSDGDNTSDSSSSGVYIKAQRSAVPRAVKMARTNAAGSKAKPRPVAYSTRQKQQKEELLKEVEVLEAQVDSMRAKAGIAPLAVSESIKQTEWQNRVMEQTRREQLLSLYGTRSVLSQHLRAQFPVPVNIPIRLGTDPVQRRQELLSSSRLQLDTAYRFLEERFRGVDGQQRYQDREMWRSPDGDFCVASSDLMLFHGVKSVKQVFDALQFYLVNMEISISEVLGQLTIREDIDNIDTLVSNHRLISSNDYGIVVEANSATFSEYFEKFADHNDEEFALLTSDFVTEDELFPYCPQERVRKNISGAVSLRPLHCPSNSGELVVVMRRAAFLSIEKPQFPVSDAALADLEYNVGSWGDVMIKSMRDVLYTSKETPHPRQAQI